MSDSIGPVHVKERPGSEMQSRIDAEVCFSILKCILVVECLNFSHDTLCLLLNA